MEEKVVNRRMNREDVESLRSLLPGTMVDLQITTPTAPRRVKTGYVGMELGNCLLFQAPTSAKWMSTRDLLTIGNDLVVRYVLEGDAGQVIAFRVKVLKLLSKPTGLLITSFPSHIESIGLRANKRSQPGISVIVTSETFPEADKVTGIIVDISQHGCKIALPLNPEWPVLLDNANLTLTYSTDGVESKIQASVRNHKLESDFVYYGVKFNSDSETVNALLSRHTLIS
ncbi:hypothetical protein EP12_09930 [Alteromonas australica]|jgi:PilZ domain/Flagellar protein YcgR|uniref:Flagellar brake protein n=1 Tax=Alteromonas australica TaxID=589873 RepID=A0A075NZI6_9ALTE|nr:MULTISPECIES: PilZ domain-containing protein [Alteromonas]AIF98943.1 hypothetical protein EP13_09770 [Alteromonas australica]AJP43933.1 hypothetical protein EP12_09930 [Alteromonas australica]QPL51753.1 flagellar brake protein [Alteromonas sp. B31-7]